MTVHGVHSSRAQVPKQVSEFFFANERVGVLMGLHLVHDEYLIYWHVISALIAIWSVIIYLLLEDDAWITSQTK